MLTAPDYEYLLRQLTLGTARATTGDEPLRAWLTEREATDPTADAAEQLLAAWAIAERTHRLRPGGRVGENENPPAPAEVSAYASGRLGRGLQLILRGTYPELLPEAIGLLLGREQVVPPHLLPDLLERALALLDDDFNLADQLLTAGGLRAVWLARLNPEWAELAPDFDFATAFHREATPGRRLRLLRRWRHRAPATAREGLAEVWPGQSPKNQEVLLAGLEAGLSAADLPWLRQGLEPKRKGVRREILRLLLLAGEEQATEEMLALTATALGDDGKLGAVHPTQAGKETINAYGGLQRNETLPEWLLALLPPNILPDLLGLPAAEYWASLPKAQLKVAASAVLAYPAIEAKADFTRFALIVNPAQLPLEAAARIAAQLPSVAFETIFHDLLDQEKNVLHYGSVARVLALSRREPWSVRISKAFLLQLVATLRDLHDLPYGLQRDLQSQWKLSIPLLHPSVFQWARTQLHAMTERADGFGKLATDTLRALAFRTGIAGE